jgi:MscS family membrane protein
LKGIRELLRQHPNADPQSIRVRFIRFGTFSLDIDIFAYISVHDWNEFLECQEELLFRIADIVHEAGTGFAFPSQTLYLASDRSDGLAKPVSINRPEREDRRAKSAR